MATTKVSQLAAKTSPSGSEELLINDGGTSKKITIANLPDTNTTYSVGDGGLTQNNFTDALKSKLDGIEASATADQSNAEIKTAYEANSDTNAFTDADHSKLDGIEASATADQTASEIKTAYESNSDTNAFTDADHSKLDGISASANNYVHPNHSGEVTSTADGATVIADNVVDEANLKVSNTPTNGYFLSAQSGNTGGMTWAEVDALPSQSGNSGKYLTTNGSAASWAVLDTDANTTTKGLYEHAHTISSNYSITSGNNALTAGAITINSGVSVTVPSGSTWVIA